ncbi:hypothetical protein BKA62DRAFT_625146, partial [Auriculariales sp. MPI-PUGE-AT-0066]
DSMWDDSYENLMRLASQLGEARPRGVPDAIIANLPTGLYKDFQEVEGDTSRCPICLDDYDVTDVVMRLTECTHWMHKVCLEVAQRIKEFTACILMSLVAMATKRSLVPRVPDARQLPAVLNGLTLSARERNLFRGTSSCRWRWLWRRPHWTKSTAKCHARRWTAPAADCPIPRTKPKPAR